MYEHISRYKGLFIISTAQILCLHSWFAISFVNKVGHTLSYSAYTIGYDNNPTREINIVLLPFDFRNRVYSVLLWFSGFYFLLGIRSLPFFLYTVYFGRENFTLPFNFDTTQCDKIYPVPFILYVSCKYF